MPGLPKKNFRVVEVDRPWAALRNQLTGDVVTDRKLVMDFCSRRGVSVQTATAKMKLFDRQTTPITQPRGIRSGRANPKRAGA